MKILFGYDNYIEGYREELIKGLNKKFNETKVLTGSEPIKKERSLLYKIARELNKSRLNTRLFNLFLENHYNKLLENAEIFDVFFSCNAYFSPKFMEKLKEKAPGIKTILFLYDTIGQHETGKTIHLYDEIFTFDKNDALKYGFEFRPSFYLNKSLYGNEEKIYDIYYLGAYREKKRFDYIMKIVDLCEEKSLTYLAKVFINKKNMKKNKLKLDEKNEGILTDKYIDYFENLENMKKSKVAVEINYGDQTGLTLRSLEAIASQTKLITTNSYIKNYDFYDENNIYIISNPEDLNNIPIQFFKIPYKKANQKRLYKYSIDGFLNDIF